MKDDGNILPLPSIVVEKRQLVGCDVAVIIVQPSRDTPVRYRGRVWIKVVAADDVVVPLAPDVYSLQGLCNLGPTLRRWRDEWAERRGRNPVADLHVPVGTMRPIGYVVMQHAVRLDRPVAAHARWMARIPDVYAQAVMNDHHRPACAIDADPHCLATLRHFRSLMPLAQEAHKPMFALKPADGAIGGHANAVADCRRDFHELARVIAERTGIAFGGPGETWRQPTTNGSARRWSC